MSQNSVVKNGERTFRVPAGTTPYWRFWGLGLLIASICCWWRYFAASDPGARGIAILATIGSAWYLTTWLSRSRTFYVDPYRIGWRLGPLERHVSWKDVMRVEWCGKSLFRRLRLRGLNGSLSIPFTLQGYAEVYRIVAQSVPEAAVAIPQLPWIVAKDSVWKLFLTIALYVYVLLAGLFGILEAVARTSGTQLFKAFPLVVGLGALSILIGVVQSWRIRRVLEAVGERITFADDGIHESFRDGTTRSWVTSAVEDVSLGEAPWSDSENGAGGAAVEELPALTVRVQLTGGDVMELRGNYLGFRADQLAHTLSKTYGVPLSTYNQNPVCEKATRADD